MCKKEKKILNKINWKKPLKLIYHNFEMFSPVVFKLLF